MLSDCDDASLDVFFIPFFPSRVAHVSMELDWSAGSGHMQLLVEMRVTLNRVGRRNR